MALGTGHEGCGGRAEDWARWMDCLRACSASGISAAEYRRREGLYPTSFYHWRRALGDTRADMGRSGAEKQEASVAALFAELQSPALGQDARARVLSKWSWQGTVCLA